MEKGLNYSGGIMQPEPDFIDPKSAEFDDTGLMYSDPNREQLAKCPFKAQFCERCCSLLSKMSIDGEWTYYCSQSAIESQDGTFIREVFPARVKK